MSRDDVRKEVASQESRTEVAESRVEEFRSDDAAKESAIEGARTSGQQVKTGAFIARPEAGEILVYEVVEVRNSRSLHTGGEQS